jgi:hypothetical protein
MLDLTVVGLMVVALAAVMQVDYRSPRALAV